MSDLIIIQHNDLAVNMTENCQYQQLLIDQYIKMVLQKCLKQPKQCEINRLPFSIYSQSIKIFKQENKILTYLIKRIKELFYLQEFKSQQNNFVDEGRNKYLDLLFGMKSYKVVIMSQIIVRIVLLALTIHIGQKDTQIFKYKFSRLIQDLKIDLILNPQSISDLLIKELQIMSQYFNTLQYYEELQSIFEKLQVNKIVKWIQSAIEKKKSKYEIKTQTTVPYKLESNNKINPKQPLNSTQQANPINSKILEQSKIVQTKGCSQTKIDKKQIRKSSPHNPRRLSTIVLANKLRKSIGVPTTRFSTKYTFKSTKKQSQQEVVVYQQETDLECTSIDNKEVYQHKKQRKQNISSNKNECEENNLVLCPATPPKTNRKCSME